MKEIEYLKNQYIKHRLELSEELRHSIVMKKEKEITELKLQIEKLDEIIKILFNK